MGLKFKNGYDFDDLGVQLKNEAEYASKKAREFMRTKMMATHKLAIRMVPVDKGRLEESITYIEQRGDRHRIEFSVEAGGFVDGKNVSKYMLLIHENYESYNPGKKTLDKRAQNPDIYIGSKYLTRAFDENMKGYEEDLEDLVIAAFL